MLRAAIDLGASSGRVVVGEMRDGRMHMREVHRFANGAVQAGHGLFWDALGLWREIKTGLRAAGQIGQISTVGVCTWGVDYALLDARGELMGNPRSHRDHRTDGVMTQALAQLGRERIFNSTGIQFMSINTLYQLMAERRDNPAGLERAAHWLMMPDLFHYWLTGEAINEYTNASTTQLMDMRSGRWSDDLIAAADLPRRLFTQPVQPGANLGKLRADVAAETGLHDARVIVVGTHDTASAVAALQPLTPGEAYISSGTWSLVGVAAPKAVITPQALAANMTNEGGCFDTIRLLKNVMGMWLIQRCRDEWAQAGTAHTFEEIVAMAQASACRSMVDAASERLLNPQNMVDEIRALCSETSQPVPNLPADVARCVFESLAQTYTRVLGELESVSGTPIHTVHVVGGGAKNTLLNNLTAAACGKRVIAGESEATSLGNLLVQARA
jgi:rhamnulokinase